jgi:hypothetical protein
MVPKKLVPHLMRDGNRFSDQFEEELANNQSPEQCPICGGNIAARHAVLLPDPEVPLGKQNGELIMRLALLTGVAAAALSFIGTASAQSVYMTDPDFVADPNVVVTQPNVIATSPGYVYAVPAPPFGPFTPRYMVTQPTVVVAPPAVAPRERVIERERVVISPRTRGGVRERVVERERVVAPRERVVERERVIMAPSDPVVVAPRESGIVTTGYSSSGCFIDRNGFERCY